MSLALRQICAWLAASSLSAAVQGTWWAIPAIQTVHILGVASAVACASMISLRLAGLFAAGEDATEVMRRILRVLWCALAVLFLSGALLIIAEPARTLANPVFAL